MKNYSRQDHNGDIYEVSSPDIARMMRVRRDDGNSGWWVLIWLAFMLALYLGASLWPAIGK